jgi:toxin ParE1/3/4
MSHILRRPGVDDDVYFLALYLLEQNEVAARRFVDAVEVTLKEMAIRPGMGSPKLYDDPPKDVRSWAVHGFPNHLIYYIPLPDGIDVLSIMHGARDVQRHLLKRV